MWRIILVYILSLSSIQLVLGQDDDNQIKGVLKHKIAEPIDTVGQCVIFKKNVIKIKHNNKKYTEGKFFIDVPTGFEFDYLQYKGRKNIYFFTNDNEIIAIVFYPDGENKSFESGIYSEIITNKVANFPLHRDIKLEKDKYCGIYTIDNYALYYMNVSKVNKELFDKSLKSIRKSPPIVQACKNKN